MHLLRLTTLLALATSISAATVKSSTRPEATSVKPPTKPKPTHPSTFIPEFKSVTIPGNVVPGIDRSNSASRISAPPKDHKISYFVDNGQAITQGDISLGPESHLLASAAKLQKRSEQGRFDLDKRAHSIFPTWESNKWPNALFLWKFNDTNAETSLQYVMDQAILRWKGVAPFFRFKQLPTSSSPDLGIVTVVVTEGAPACWAPIGYNEFWPMVISLDTSCWIGATAHEIGHALGLHHEHQRPDRDDYMTFNCSALADYHLYGTPESSCPGNPEACCEDATCWGWACSFTHFTHLDSSGPIDSLSVMHYREDGFSNFDLWPNHRTLIGKGSYVVPPWDNEGPSTIDGARICQIYSVDCERGPAPEPICGNNIIEDSEECDDGNTTAGDGCSPTCTIERPPGTCERCIPNPLQNKCDITTSCISTLPGGATYCACRAGFKAEEGAGGMWRLPFVGQEYRVFVEPGVVCNTLCEDWDMGGDAVCAQVEKVDSCGGR